MEQSRFQLHPFIRIFVLIAGAIGTILAHKPIELFCFEISLLPFIITAGSEKLLITFCFVVIIPMLVMYSVFHYLTDHHNLSLVLPEIKIILKLTIYTTLCQIALLIPLKYVHNTFKIWGMKNQFLLTATGSYFVWADIISRSERILLARFGNGYVEKRTFFGKAKQIPSMIIPLIVSIMRTATIRSDSWQQKEIVTRIELVKFPPIPVHTIYNAVITILTLSWLFINIYNF